MVFPFAFYGIYKQSHLIGEHGAGFDFIYSFISKPTIMNKNEIMKMDILDILFNNRNKAYGAYILRKNYPDRIKKAFVLMMILASGFLAFTFIPTKLKVFSTTGYVIDDIRMKEVDKKIKEPEKKKEQAKTEVKVSAPTQKKFVSTPVIVANNIKSDTIQTLQAVDVIGTTTINNGLSSPPLVNVIYTDNGGLKAEAVVKTDKTLPMDASNVDVPPTFPGGMLALRKFLERHLTNPEEVNEGEAISVKVKFVVGYDGKLQSFVNVQDGGRAFNNEVVRVLKKMPDWIPGKANGENVSVYFTLPVKFVAAN